MNKGWVKIHRKILDWEWYTDPNTFRLFFHCLIKANIENKSWKGQEILIGSFITSIGNLANELELTSQNVRTSLKKLEKSQNLTIKSTNKYTLVSVVKYTDYQILKSNLTNNLTNEQQTTNKQLTNKLTTTKEVKNIRSKEVNNNTFNKSITKKSFKEVYDNYDFDKKTKEAILEFYKYRNEMQKSKRFTILSFDKFLKKISKWSSEEIIQGIDQSIMNNYQGIFKPKNTAQNENSKTTNREIRKFDIDASINRITTKFS